MQSGLQISVTVSTDSCCSVVSKTRFFRTKVHSVVQENLGSSSFTAVWSEFHALEFTFSFRSISSFRVIQLKDFIYFSSKKMQSIFWSLGYTAGFTAIPYLRECRLQDHSQIGLWVPRPVRNVLALPPIKSHRILWVTAHWAQWNYIVSSYSANWIKKAGLGLGI